MKVVFFQEVNLIQQRGKNCKEVSLKKSKKQ